MALTSSNFCFYSPNKIESAGNLTIQEFNSATGAWDAVDYGITETSKLIDHETKALFEFSSGSKSKFRAAQIHVSLSSAQTLSAIMLKNIRDISGELAIALNASGDALTVIGDVAGDGEWSNWTNGNLLAHFEEVVATEFNIQFYIADESLASMDYALGEIMLMKRIYELPRNPNFSGYKPMLTGLRESKKMADGGVSTFQVKEKFSARIDLDYVPADVTSELRSLYETASSFVFCPFPTVGNGSDWDGDAWEVNWIGNFEFLQPAYNDRNTPLYRGSINLAEVPA